ncbi:MAG: uracil-DNA glycosylase, partial [Acidobacteriota bacterium]
MDRSKELRDLIRDVREQVTYLNELGVETLRADLSELQAAVPTAEMRAHVVTPNALPQPPKVELKPIQPKVTSRSRLNSLPSLAKRTPNTRTVDEEMKPDFLPPVANIAGQAETMFESISVLPETDETMEQIWADIGNCTRCPLHEGRTQIVQSVGNYTADLMFVGEAPGAAEDAKGEPFVGRAGQLLNKIIEAIGMKREEVCIGNINRCRPPANRQPTLPEAHTCRPFLIREIAVIRPKVIVVMGNTALHNLLDTKIGITRMRGQFHDYFGVKVMPTFHPAYLLRDPSKKREVWDDMKMVK